MLPRILLSKACSGRQSRLLREVRAQALVFQAMQAEEFWGILRTESIDVILARPSDLGPDPVAALGMLRAAPHPPEVLLMTADPAGHLLAAGAVILAEELPLQTRIEIVLLALGRASLKGQTVPRAGSYIDRTLSAFGGTSRIIRHFREEVRRAAAGEAPILIRGEIGTGKTWLGPMLHVESPRARGSFQRFSCAVVDKDVATSTLFGHGPGAAPGRARAGRGLFQKAHRGSLFLENVDRAPAAVQQELVSVLELGAVRPLGVGRSVKVDVRLLASIQSGPDGSAGGRADLVEGLQRRFELADLVVPTLRERTEDVPDLAAAVLEYCRRRYGSLAAGFSDAALDALCRHTWPGNLKECWSVVERAAILARGDEIQIGDLPVELLAAGGRHSQVIHVDAPWLADPARLPTLREVRSSALEVVDRAFLHRVLQETSGRIGEAASRAGIDPRSLRGLMRRHGLQKEDYKGRPPSE